MYFGNRAPFNCATGKGEKKERKSYKANYVAGF